MPLAPASAACRARPVGDRTVEADAGDHGHRALRFFDRCAHDREMLGRGQRIELAGATGGDDRRRRVLQHGAEVAAQPVEVERQVSVERRNGKTDHALQPRSQLTW